MTERAKRALSVLNDRGWLVDDVIGENKPCLGCGNLIERGCNYCSQCGKQIPKSFADSSVQDMEAALLAADVEVGE